MLWVITGTSHTDTVIIRNLFTDKIHNTKICGIADRLSSRMLALAF